MNKEVELIDLVDASGHIQKQGIPRSDLDLYPNLHLQIVILVIFDIESGGILVQKRAQTKKTNPGYIDHVCGGITSGETPEEAAVRESIEETGIHPFNLMEVTKGINKYNRYRYLLVGESDSKPGQINPSEVEWVRFVTLGELKEKELSGEFIFVEEFFEETELAKDLLSSTQTDP